MGPELGTWPLQPSIVDVPPFQVHPQHPTPHPVPDRVTSPAKRVRFAGALFNSADKATSAEKYSSLSDKLGELIVCHTSSVRKNGFDRHVILHRHKDDWGALRLASRHPAARLLNHYKRHGTPVVLADTPWTTEEKSAALRRGPHKSAYDNIDFLRDEMADMVIKNQWTVLPFELVKDLPNLRLSPIGVVPQHDRRPRTIVDLSYFGVNDATQPAAALDAMQFGRALERIIRDIVCADPSLGPIKLIKVDLADGFYRMTVAPTDVAKLGVLFPSLPGEPPLVAFPLALPMGWKNSPPLFCTATETVADIANAHILKHKNPPSHALEREAESPAQDQPLPKKVLDPKVAVPVPTNADPFLNHSRRRQLGKVEIYMDDYIAAAQGDKQTLAKIRRILFHAIDDVFRPLEPGDNQARKEPISVSKLRKGDADWSTCKKVLGWLIDTVELTIQLPPRRMERLQALLDKYPPDKRRAAVLEWQQLLGELRSMTVALPGSRGLYSELQNTLRHPDSTNRVRLSAAVHSALGHFQTIVHQLDQRPTRLPELVPLQPTVTGNVDAAGCGAGGVLLPSNNAVPRRARYRTLNLSQTTVRRPVPVLWRMRFPKDITDRLVTFKNPNGDITNSDLELAGSLIQMACAAECFDTRERTILSRTDNLATMYWRRKHSTSASTAHATLLQLQAFHQRFHRYISLIDYIPGPQNKAADDASRLQHLSHTQFLTHFNMHYPQARSWHLWKVPRALRSAVIGILRNKPYDSASYLREPPQPIEVGQRGLPSVTNWPSIPFSPMSNPQIESSSFKSSFIASDQERLHQVGNQSEPAQLKMPYGRLAKRSLQWGPRIPDSHYRATWISASPASLLATRARILHPTGSSRSRSVSFSMSSTSH